MIFIAGDLGGYLGLFLGASALSVVELLDWVIYKMLKARPDTHAQRSKRSQNTLPKSGGLANIPIRYRAKPVPDMANGFFPQYGFPRNEYDDILEDGSDDTTTPSKWLNIP